jgi:hypothetical protein
MGVLDQPPKRAVPQLNEAETEDKKDMLVWLLKRDTTVFRAMSPITFSIVEAWRKVELDLCTDGNPICEGQACIMHHCEGQFPGGSRFSAIRIPRGLGSRPLQIPWPRDKSKAMIDALGVGRALEDAMLQAWQYEKDAADHLDLLGKADGPYGHSSEVYYTLQVSDDLRVTRRYGPHTGMLSDQGFPADTEKTHNALKWTLVGEPADCSRWLHNHVAQDYLLRVENANAVYEQQYKSVYFKYQALIFGFYYQLLRQLLSSDLVENTAFFHGIWGAHSTTFLAICTQLRRCLRSDEKISRTHILYVLAAMYNGRRKIFNTTSALPRLVGVLGPISVLALPLVHTTDELKEISRITVVDLPIVDLVADSADGDLMTSDGGGLHFEQLREGRPRQNH